MKHLGMHANINSLASDEGRCTKDTLDKLHRHLNNNGVSSPSIIISVSNPSIVIRVIRSSIVINVSRSSFVIRG